MRWSALVLVVALVTAGCGSKDEPGPAGPTSAFSTPTDGSEQIPQGTAPTVNGVTVGVGGVLTNPDRAMLSVHQGQQMAEVLTLGVGEKATVQGHTILVTAIQQGERAYVWVKVTPA
ncbi:hypothetical protein [Streptomyces sp. SID13031]|uniref:hypothetical protein n=1 Tax=Streptomyces sp. SID13031 TaxID=2706046 RepID=UPI0013CC1605|nr:hypothetical protein [Streptomyces sp. SID13031]NEA31516.1 hypothetical protein [Streptomyces sp. SID13031]